MEIVRTNEFWLALGGLVAIFFWVRNYVQVSSFAAKNGFYYKLKRAVDGSMEKVKVEQARYIPAPRQFMLLAVLIAVVGYSVYQLFVQ